MSLIRVRRRRKKNWIGIRKGMSPTRALGLLALAVTLIWYLSRNF